MDFFNRLADIIVGDGLLYGSTVEKIFGFALCVIVPYLLGSLNFGIIISKCKYGQDIRDFGSGNAGMTNMMRTYGKGAAAATFLLDASKAVLSAFLGYLLLPANIGAHIACVACMLGHAYPLFFGFKGGKGVTVACFSLLLIDPLFCLILVALFVIIVAATRYISLGSIIAAGLYPVLYIVLSPPQHIAQIICPFLVAFLVIFWHRTNIRRLIDGNENKFSFKKK